MTGALVFLADGSEEMEAVTVIDLLRRAHVKVTVVGLSKEVVVASRGVRLLVDASIDEVSLSGVELVVLPGGLGGTDAFEQSESLLSLLRQAEQEQLLIAAICAAPRALDKAGLLAGKTVTSYPGALDPESTVYHYVEDSVVVDGRLITSRGPGTALDFALTLVERLRGPELRAQVEAPLMRPQQGH